MSHNGYYAQALDVIAGTINSPHRSGKTLAMLQSIDRDTAQAVAIEREAIAAWLMGCHDEQVAMAETLKPIDANESRVCYELAGAHRYAAQAIRNGEHVKP